MYTRLFLPIRKFIKATIFLVPALCLFVTSCSPATATPKPKEPVTLTMADALQPSTLDIGIQYEVGALTAIRTVYERLVQYDKDTTNIAPELATSWENSADGKQWTFHLRKDVKFHDGQPFNADAVKFSFDRMIKLNQGPAWMFTPIDNIEVVDANTVKFNLKTPYPAFLAALANTAGTGIVSPKAVKDHEVNGDAGQEYLREHMIGTGPYKFVEWLHGDHLTLERNLDYWGGWPQKDGQPIDRVIIKYITEPATQRLLLEKGDIDVAYSLTISDLNAVSKEKGITLFSKPSMMSTFVFFDVDRPPLDNVKVRQAIRYALDWDAIINKIMNGYAVQMQGPVPLQLAGHDDTLPIPKQDMEKAKQLMAESGVKTPITLEYLYETGVEDRRMVGELMQSNLAPLGINLEVHTSPWETIWARVADKKQIADITLNGWWPDYADAQDYLYPMHHSSQWPPANVNIGFYKNPEVDSLLDKAMVEMNDNTRYDLYKQAQQIIYEDCHELDLYQKNMNIAFRDRVKGFIFNPLYAEALNLYDMRITQ
jgi:peptide/nickel transport system substrate-binding protein